MFAGSEHLETAAEGFRMFRSGVRAGLVRTVARSCHSRDGSEQLLIAHDLLATD
jgi:hypothetical protein